MNSTKSTMIFLSFLKNLFSDLFSAGYYSYGREINLFFTVVFLPRTRNILRITGIYTENLMGRQLLSYFCSFDHHSYR